MTYNFDPDRWYEDQRLRLQFRRRSGGLSDAELQAALDALDRRYEEMLGRLDGTYELPKGPAPRPDSP